MAGKLSPHQLDMLRKLEPALMSSVKNADVQEAEGIIKSIQLLFIKDRNHHRLLRAKNWYYELLIECGRTDEAKQGLEAVLKRANEGTRLNLEANALLAVCYLRLGDIPAAKKVLRPVVLNINSISSETRRRQFQKRLLGRIEDEVLLSLLVGRDEGELNPELIQAEAVKLLGQKSPEEIYAMIGSHMPDSAGHLILNVKSYALGLMPSSDQKLLACPADVIPKEEIGKKTMAALKRVGWRSFCDPKSEVYKMWKAKLPKVFNGGYFTLALTVTLTEWKIGLPGMATGLAAVALRYGCEEFCDAFKPDGLMIPRSERE